MKFRFAVSVLIALFLEFLLLLTVQAQTPGSASAPQPTVPAAPDPAYDPARKLLQQGKYDEAIAALTARRSQTPAPKGLDHELGVAYYKKGDYPNAVRSLQAAQKEEPNDGEIIQLTGLTLYLAGKPADAIPFLEKVQTWYPRANIDAAYILGVAYVQTKKYSEGRAAFAKMFGVPPDSAAAYLFAARMLLRLDFGPIAEEYGLKAVSLDPKLPLAHQLLGELYLYQSKISEAVAQLEQEVAVNPANPANPANPVALYKLTDAYARIQKFDEAEKLLQRSIWLDATSTALTSSWGKCWRKKAKRCSPCAPCNAPSTWIPTIPLRTTCSARRTATSAGPKKRNANSLAEQLQGRDVSRQQ